MNSTVSKINPDFREYIARIKSTQRSAVFLSRVQSILCTLATESLIVKKAAQAAVPLLGDICAVGIVNPGGELARVEFAWRYWADAELVSQLRKSLAHRKARPASATVDVRNDDRDLCRILLWMTHSKREIGTSQHALIQDFAARVSDGIVHCRELRRASQEELEGNEFIAVAAHEIKNALTGLDLQAKLLTRFAGTNHDAREQAVGRLCLNVQQVVGKVQAFLDTDRLERGSLHLNVEPLLLDEIVQGYLDQYEPVCAKAGCELKAALEPGLCGQWDKVRIEQAFTNILLNATKYAAGKPIEVRAFRRGSQGLISITDHGRGIPPAEQGRVFERFRRGDSAERISGSGLGLYVAQSLIQAHGGTVSVTNAAGKGAEFTIALPLS